MVMSEVRRWDVVLSNPFTGEVVHTFTWGEYKSDAVNRMMAVVAGPVWLGWSWEISEAGV